MIAIPLIIYFISGIPQILDSWRRRSARGVNPEMIFVRFCANAFFLIYLFSFNLPLAYKVIMPLYVAKLAIMAWQSYFFARRKKAKRKIFNRYLIALSALVLAGMGAFMSPLVVGSLCGWIAVTGNVFCEFPQMLSNYMRQSTKGFSLTYATIMAFGSLCELMAAYILGLPIQSLIICSVIIAFYIGYLVQVQIYCPKGKKYRQLSAYLND